MFLGPVRCVLRSHRPRSVGSDARKVLVGNLTCPGRSLIECPEFGTSWSQLQGLPAAAKRVDAEVGLRAWHPRDAVVLPRDLLDPPVGIDADDDPVHRMEQGLGHPDDRGLRLEVQGGVQSRDAALEQ